MNVTATIFDPTTGEIITGASLSPETFEYYVTSGSHAVLDVAGDSRTHYVNLTTSEVTAYTVEELATKDGMGDGWMWQMPERIAVDARVLADVKLLKNAEINQKRLLANRTSFPFAGKSIACDELSMLDIQSLNGLVTLTGDLPPSFQKQWKATDNSYVAIPDKATWISFIATMVSTGQTNFDHAQTLKSALAAATTNADVDAITW
jgi:hypothetical protein